MQSVMKLPQREPLHTLYSRGQLTKSAEADRETALAMLASATRRTSHQVKERLLSGQRKKIKSSASMKKLILLQQKLTDCGLDVYIKPDPDA